MLEFFTATITRPRPRHTFKTSLEVVKEVMNVPMEAIHAIARMNGISTADDHTNIISESMLQPFVEAFERKTRNYFVNSMRNGAQLTPTEFQTFSDFRKTFKKDKISFDKVCNWNHIDKIKLQEFFVEQIKEKTSSSSTHHTNLDLFSGIGGIEAGLETAIYNEIEPAIYSSVIDDYLLSAGSEYFDFCYQQHQSQGLLERITSNWCYHLNIESPQYHGVNTQDIIRQIVLSARYYVYVDDDDHELLKDTRFFHKIRVLKEVA